MGLGAIPILPTTRLVEVVSVSLVGHAREYLQTLTRNLLSSSPKYWINHHREVYKPGRDMSTKTETQNNPDKN